MQSEAAALPPTRAEVVPLYASDELTVMKVVRAPRMSFPAHNHRMWAAVGIYGGDEDNTLSRRSGPGIVVSGALELHTGDVCVLGEQAIHAVVNPSGSYRGDPRLRRQPALPERPQRMGRGHAGRTALRLRAGTAPLRGGQPHRVSHTLSLSRHGKPQNPRKSVPI